MGTRSTIAAKIGDNVKSIYCHWDGYVEHNGKILFEHYNTQEKIEKLIALGSLSSLAESCECPEGHSYDNQIKGYTVAYHRDRGEDVKINTSITEKGIHEEEYNYYWDGIKWLAKKGYSDRAKWTSLKEIF